MITNLTYLVTNKHNLNIIYQEIKLIVDIKVIILNNNSITKIIFTKITIILISNKKDISNNHNNIL